MKSAIPNRVLDHRQKQDSPKGSRKAVGPCHFASPKGVYKRVAAMRDTEGLCRKPLVCCVLLERMEGAVLLQSQ